MTVTTDNTLDGWIPETLGRKRKRPAPTTAQIEKRARELKEAQRRRLLCLSVATRDELGNIERWGDQLGKSKRQRRLYDELHQRAFHLMANATDDEIEMLDSWLDQSQLSNIRELMIELRGRT